jgi:hypothetical protein
VFAPPFDLGALEWFDVGCGGEESAVDCDRDEWTPPDGAGAGLWAPKSMGLVPERRPCRLMERVDVETDSGEGELDADFVVGDWIVVNRGREDRAWES